MPVHPPPGALRRLAQQTRNSMPLAGSRWTKARRCARDRRNAAIEVRPQLSSLLTCPGRAVTSRNLKLAPEGSKEKSGRASSPRPENSHGVTAQPSTCGALNVWQFRWQFVGNSRQFGGFSGNSGFGRRPECGDGGNSVPQSLAFNNLKRTPREPIAPRAAEGATFLEFYVGVELFLCFKAMRLFLCFF